MQNQIDSPSVRPFLGFGLGLRPQHYEELLAQQPPLDWLEALSENYLIPGGKPIYYLDKIRELYPLVLHGVSMSIGSCDSIDYQYLKQLKSLINRIQPEWISDHLCWTGKDKLNMHDLLPLPYTEHALNHVVEKVKKVQDFLQQQILLENVSSYVSFKQSSLTEWDFLNEVARRADCYLLIDINNIYVSGFNHGYDPCEYIRGLDGKRIRQMHLAGHANHGDYIIDTHDAPVISEVWQLYAFAIQHFGPVSTMIERDDNIPPLSELLLEVEQAKALAGNYNTEIIHG